MISAACFFIGSDIVFWWEKKRLKKEITKTVRNLISEGVMVFYTACDRGFEVLAAECVLEIMKNDPAVKLFVWYPYRTVRKALAAKRGRASKIWSQCSGIRPFRNDKLTMSSDIAIYSELAGVINIALVFLRRGLPETRKETIVYFLLKIISKNEKLRQIYINM